MNVDERTFANVTVLAPRGRVDHDSADAFGEALAPHLDRCSGEDCKLVLDLSGVDYISSIGLRVLMVAAKQGRTQQGTIVVSDLDETLREIFQISRFNRVFKVFETARDALAEISPEALAAFDAGGPPAPGAPC